MQQPAASTAESSSSSVHNRQTTASSPTTPQNTPARDNVQSDNNENTNDAGVLLCPRGLAAIPLLCAAASESRSAYLARLQVTHPSNGVSFLRTTELLVFAPCSKKMWLMF